MPRKTNTNSNAALEILRNSRGTNSRVQQPEFLTPQNFQCSKARSRPLPMYWGTCQSWGRPGRGCIGLARCCWASEVRDHSRRPREGRAGSRPRPPRAHSAPPAPPARAGCLCPQHACACGRAGGRRALAAGERWLSRAPGARAPALRHGQLTATGVRVRAPACTFVSSGRRHVRRDRERGRQAEVPGRAC